MKLSHLNEAYPSKEGTFNYDHIAKEVWGEKFKEAKEEFSATFDLENDEDVVTRDVEIEQDCWDYTKCKFRCELRKAGGDWEYPSIYFRCQLTDGHAFGLSKYGESLFCVIPPKDSGNSHFIKGKGGYGPPNNGEVSEDEVEEPSEKKSWEFLKSYLQELVNKEIKEVEAGRV